MTWATAIESETYMCRSVSKQYTLYPRARWISLLSKVIKQECSMTIAQNCMPFLVKLSKESGPAMLSMMLLMYVTVMHDEVEKGARKCGGRGTIIYYIRGQRGTLA